MDGEVGAGDAGAFGEVPELGGVEIGRRVGIDDFAAGFAVEMDVLVEIGAVAGLAALEVDELDDSGRGEVVETVINRGEGDVRGALLHPGVEVCGGGMIRGGGKHFKDFPAVRGESDIRPEQGQTAVKAGWFGRLALGGRWHGLLELELE